MGNGKQENREGILKVEEFEARYEEERIRKAVLPLQL